MSTVIEQQETPGQRIRRTRENAGLSRRKLADMSGVSPSSIEKYETGNMDPTVSALCKLTDALEVSVGFIVHGIDDELDTDDHGEDKDIDIIEDIDDRAAEPDAVADLLDALAEVDDLRADGFSGTGRKALALTGSIAQGLRLLDPGDVVKIADERGLHRASVPHARDLSEMLAEDGRSACPICDEIDARIIDTALFGTDLYDLDVEAMLKEPLIFEIADSKSGSIIQGMFVPKSHEKLVPTIRAELREAVLFDGSVDLNDREKFPRRKD